MSMKKEEIIVKKMKRQFKITLVPSPPFDFQLTFHKRAGWYWLTPFEIFENQTLWSGFRLNSEPIGSKIRSVGTISNPKISVEVFVRKRLTKGEIRKIKEFLFEAIKIDQDLKRFYKFCKKFPVLKEATRSLYGMHTASDPELLHSAIRTISSHMCRTKRAIAILDAILRNYGEAVEFDGKRIILWPTKEKLDSISEAELREKCNLGYRAKFLKSLVREACKGNFPDREELLQLSPQEAKRLLMGFKGIGGYSAEILSPHPGFPLDVWSVIIFQRLFRIPKDRSTRDMILVVKKWAEENFGEWRGLAFSYILNDLRNLKEKFGVDVGGAIADYLREKKEEKKAKREKHKRS